MGTTLRGGGDNEQLLLPHPLGFELLLVHGVAKYKLNPALGTCQGEQLRLPCVSSNVTTGTRWGRPEASGARCSPAEITRTLLKIVRVIWPSSARFLGDPVSNTSTRASGKTKPATPLTSLTRTAMARIPSGTLGARPTPDPGTANLRSTMGSLIRTRLTVTRVMTSSICWKLPSGILLAGHGSTLRSVPRLPLRCSNPWPRPRLLRSLLARAGRSVLGPQLDRRCRRQAMPSRRKLLGLRRHGNSCKLLSTQERLRLRRCQP